jgi:hypothetical protein
MKDKELKFEEMEVSLTVRGLCRGWSEVVWRGEGEGEGRGEGVDDSLLSDTLTYISLTEVGIDLVGLRGPMDLCPCVSEVCGDGKGADSEALVSPIELTTTVIRTL